MYIWIGLCQLGQNRFCHGNSVELAKWALRRTQLITYLKNGSVHFAFRLYDRFIFPNIHMTWADSSQLRAIYFNRGSLKTRSPLPLQVLT
jgi:hypothetical protein